MKKLLAIMLLAVPLMAQTRINGSRVIEGTLNFCSDAGANDTYTCSLSPAITAYTTGAIYAFKANTANTGAATINLNGLGAKTIKKMSSGITTDLEDNDIRSGQNVWITYDGTNMQMLSQIGNTASAGSVNFSGILTGTNTTATMTVGTGGTLTFSGSGLLNASKINGTLFNNAESLGKIPIGQGDGSATWSDPLVQGLVAHDAVDTSAPVLVGGYASAAAPTNVSADGDAVNAWYLRNGAAGVQPTFAGVLAVAGNGVAGTGVQRVTIASDSTGTVAATQSGTWTVQPGNTANTTAWKVDGSAVTQPVSGTVTVTDGAGALNVIVDSGTLAATQSGNWTARVVGNAGATLDSTVGAAAAPTNQIVTGTVYNTTAPAPTNGQAMAVQSDQAGNVRTTPGIALTTLSGWTSATSVNATQTIFSNHGVPSVLLHLVQGSTISGGAITFEVSYDNSNWVTIPADAVLDPSSTNFAQISLPYTLVQSTNKPFLLNNKGWQGLRIKLSTAITGSATVTPNYALLAYEPMEPTNVTQINGVAPSMGNGASGTGVQRVTIANDSTGIVSLATGSNTIGALTANQSVNVAQVGGTNTVNGGVAGTLAVGGTAATDAAVNANPVLAGCRAEDSTDAAGGLVVSAEGDLVPPSCNRAGAVRVILGDSRTWTYHENSSSALTDTTVHASCGTGLFNYIGSIAVSTGAATAMNVFIEDSTTTTILGPYYLEAVAGRGFSINYNPAKKQTNSATLISVTTSAAIAHSIDIQGYCAE